MSATEREFKVPVHVHSYGTYLTPPTQRRLLSEERVIKLLLRRVRRQPDHRCVDGDKGRLCQPPRGGKGGPGVTCLEGDAEARLLSVSRRFFCV